jgi:hypothetical protein
VTGIKYRLPPEVTSDRLFMLTTTPSRCVNRSDHVGLDRSRRARCANVLGVRQRTRLGMMVAVWAIAEGCSSASPQNTGRRHPCVSKVLPTARAVGRSFRGPPLIGLDPAARAAVGGRGARTERMHPKSPLLET